MFEWKGRAMDGITRRSALRAATAAGVTALATSSLHAQDNKDANAPSVKDLFEQLRRGDEQRAPKNILAANDPPVLLFHPADFKEIEPVNTIAEVERLDDARGNLLVYGLSWICAANKIHNLYLDATTPLIARSITFQYSDISWQAGQGWPVYHVRCPRDDYGQNFYYQHAKIHAIVHSIGNTYSISCLQSGIFTAASAGQVRCAANDGPGDYGDNRGAWRITLTSWS